jgi:hypothetical protein
MSSDEIWKNTYKPLDSPATSSKETGESRFCDAKAMEQREIYENHYQRIYPLLTAGELDFTQLAKQTGLKERKIRDTLLSRLAHDDLIQLFGHKEGICYICASRMRGNFTHEPLCIPCIETIGQAIIELYPAQQNMISTVAIPQITVPSNSTPSSDSNSNVLPAMPLETPAPPFPQEEMVSKTLFDAAQRELQRYRDKYGPLDDDLLDDDEADHIDLLDDPSNQLGELSTQEEETSPEPPKSTFGQTMRDILEAEDDSDELAEINHVTISPNDLPKTNDATSQTEPIRHFGFQRLKIRT